MIFHKDDAGTTLHIVQEGRVRVFLISSDGREVTLALLGSGEFFGDQSLLDGNPRSASVVAVEPTRTLTLFRDDFLRLLGTSPQAAVAILQVLCWRLRLASELLGDVAFLDVAGRLAKRLLQLASEFGQPGTRGTTIDLKITQGQLASMLGVTRESVNKQLRAFRKLGIIAINGGRLRIERPEELKRWSY
jgi:CRP-like cAMP-binding protein